MPLNPSIRKVVPGGGEALINYDFVDAAAGTGYVEYFLGRTHENGVSGAILSNQAFYSDKVLTSESFVVYGASFAIVHDVSFDILFNKPQTMRGEGIINIPIGIKEGDDDAYATFINTTTQKVDVDNVVTDIAVASGSVFIKATGGAGTYGYKVAAITSTIPLTPIKKGEKLRLNIQQWAKRRDAPDVAKTADFFFGHDPKNRATDSESAITFGTEPSIATFKVPFRIDLP